MGADRDVQHRRMRTAKQKSTSATLGFEAQLWAAANALRGSMDAAEYKHVAWGSSSSSTSPMPSRSITRVILATMEG